MRLRGVAILRLPPPTSAGLPPTSAGPPPASRRPSWATFAGLRRPLPPTSVDLCRPPADLCRPLWAFAFLCRTHRPVSVGLFLSTCLRSPLPAFARHLANLLEPLADAPLYPEMLLVNLDLLWVSALETSIAAKLLCSKAHIGELCWLDQKVPAWDESCKMAPSARCASRLWPTTAILHTSWHLGMQTDETPSSSHPQIQQIATPGPCRHNDMPSQRQAFQAVATTCRRNNTSEEHARTAPFRTFGWPRANISGRPAAELNAKPTSVPDLEANPNQYHWQGLSCLWGQARC